MTLYNFSKFYKIRAFFLKTFTPKFNLYSANYKRLKDLYTKLLIIDWLIDWLIDWFPGKEAEVQGPQSPASGYPSCSSKEETQVRYLFYRGARLIHKVLHEKED